MSASLETHRPHRAAPRYGVRTHEDSPRATDAPAHSALPENIAREAAQLGLHHLAAAMDHRMTRSWAEEQDSTVRQLRLEHPAALRDAEATVRKHLGSDRRWLLTAQTVHNRWLAPALARRRTQGLLAAAWFQRILLILCLVCPAAFLAFSGAPLATLVLVGAGSGVAALVAGYSITTRLRLPVQPTIRRAWLKELRSDIVDATLLAHLQRSGAKVSAEAASAAGRGWKHIRFVAATLDRIDAGPTA